jgi:hypothetical protein
MKYSLVKQHTKGIEKQQRDAERAAAKAARLARVSGEDWKSAKQEPTETAAAFKKDNRATLGYA